MPSSMREAFELAVDVAEIEALDLTTYQLFVLSSLGSLPCCEALRRRLGPDREHEVLRRCLHGVRGCCAPAVHTEHVFPKE